jgi:predicted RNase H-like nuclease
MARVLGVDACRAGWVGVALGAAGDPRAYLGTSIAVLVASVGPVEVVGIDIPIGLPDRGRRRADVLARAELGPRGSSVFLTPVRDALTAPDHASAVAANRAATGEGVSIQAYGLRVKLLEVDGWLRAGPPARVVEVHPELSFTRLAGAPLAASKKTWAGAETRRALLAGAGIALRGELGAAGRAGVDDVLDAAAAAWTAARVATGTARCLPDPPEVFDDGIPAAIWA